jgi:hypothetical protein
VKSAFRFILRTALLLLGTGAPHDAFAQAAADPVPVAGLFREGTAAAPFGSSTAIADFNADGAPDVAIADRTHRGGIAYTIEVRLFEGSAQTVSFQSTTGPLKITAFDVDNDHDADLVVTPVLSREVVGVWVNDGAGHFDARRRNPFGPIDARLAGVPSLSGFGDYLIPAVPGRRLYAFGLTVDPYAVRVAQDAVTVWLPRVPVAAAAFAHGISPRAPPSFRL